MATLEVNLDPFISLENIVSSPLTRPIHLLSYTEAAGVGSISFTYRNESFSAAEVKTIRSMTNSRINVRMAPDMNLVQDILLMKPDVITIINPANSHLSIDLPSKRIKEVVDTISSYNDIALCLRMEPDIRQLKEAYQLGVDEIELATNELAFKQNYIEFHTLLYEISKAIQVATKNNLRVSLGGALDMRIINTLKDKSEIEFISVGEGLLAQTLINGFQNALQTFSLKILNL